MYADISNESKCLSRPGQRRIPVEGSYVSTGMPSIKPFRAFSLAMLWNSKYVHQSQISEQYDSAHKLVEIPP